MSDTSIAEHVGVSPTFVGKHRRGLEESGSLSTVDSRQDRDGRTINTTNIGGARAAEIVLRAERRLGEMLAGIVEHGGDRKSESRSHDVTLTDLGITKMQSHRRHLTPSQRALAAGKAREFYDKAAKGRKAQAKDKPRGTKASVAQRIGQQKDTQQITEANRTDRETSVTVALAAGKIKNYWW